MILSWFYWRSTASGRLLGINRPIALVWLVCLAALLAACNQLPLELSGAAASPAPSTQPAATPPVGTAQQTTLPASPAATLTVEPPEPGPVTLRLWVPPQFDPKAGTAAGRLLQNRLDEFSQRQPEVRIETRVKAVDGPGGLYESLAATTAAAQMAMPDLVALPHPLIQKAALQGLLRPMNGLTNTLDDPDWYDYARQLARLQNSIFGLPFAGDALVQAYRTGEEVTPPTDWKAVAEMKSPLAFAAADPRALFSLAQYQAAGGQPRDEQGAPVLDPDALTEVLEFYQAAEGVEVMPFWLTQFQNDDQVWQAYQENRAANLATWYSLLARQNAADTAYSQLPTPDGKPSTLASGWVWALSSPEPQKRQLAVQLAEFLTESNFLGAWSEAAGVIPPRPTSLEAWGDRDEAGKLKEIASSAALFPGEDVLANLGPALEEATVAVLKRQLAPAEAAQGAINRLTGP